MLQASRGRDCLSQGDHGPWVAQQPEMVLNPGPSIEETLEHLLGLRCELERWWCQQDLGTCFLSCSPNVIPPKM